MPGDYFIVYNPITYQLMDLMSANSINPIDVISYLTGQDAHQMTAENFLKFIDFQTEKQRATMVDALAIEMYAGIYIQNQLARLAKDHTIVMVDGKRKYFSQVIKEKKNLPQAVFISAMSSTFPAAAATAIVLNYAKIPVIIGGIHVSTMSEDVDTFIKKYLPHPELFSIVKGAGDSIVITSILQDLKNNSLKSEYSGEKLIENGVWGDFQNLEPLEPLKINLLNRLPIIKYTSLKDFRINPVAPFTGCVFSCKFCSISTLPKKHKAIQFRDPHDFVEELLSYQKEIVNFKNRYYFFTPDNLFSNKKELISFLKKIIESKLHINYAVQISVEVADDEELLKLIRASGGTHFFIGFESLDMRNLKHINKHIVRDIEKSGMSVEKYYASKIKKIHAHGISIHGSFILGLPYDYYRSTTDNTGVDITKFCIKNRIGAQPSTIVDLPGSVFFNESQKNNLFLYGKKGSMDYFLSLSIADLAETNKIPSDSLYNSPLVIASMVYEISKKVGSPIRATINSTIIFLRSFIYPTKSGAGFRFRQRFIDAICSAVSQTAVALYKEQGESLVRSKYGVRGIMERLYNMEKNLEIKKLFKHYISQFVE
ncbi:MAG: B12-binding domain-containing radical SAM protein [Syntrophaceae bacterium]|nr:B12-binding domain-containing radical SAM protein [Syntrophaceae bacterium]